MRQRPRARSAEPWSDLSPWLYGLCRRKLRIELPEWPGIETLVRLPTSERDAELLNVAFRRSRLGIVISA